MANKPKKSKPAAKKRAPKTVATIIGVKAGDPDKLAPQPCTMANVAFELGEAPRKEYLRALKASLKTKQNVGRLFSYHKPELISRGFIKFKKIPVDKVGVKADDNPEAAPAAAPAPAVPAPTTAPEVAAPAQA